jgi:hypothetical protein
MRFIFTSIICLAFVCLTYAQQTIINMPSVDQTPKGRFFYLHESQARSWDNQQFWAMTNFFTYGITDELEVCLTQYQWGVPTQAYSAVGFGYKGTKQFFPESLKALELKISFGQMLPISTTAKGVGVWTYLLGSFKLPVFGTRLVSGISRGPRANFGFNTTHAVASVEQHLVGHWNLLAEWFSGTHENGYFIPGVNYHYHDLVVILGYKFSNKPNNSKDDAIIIEVGFFF